MAGNRKAVIIGAGPAGLTAAYELLQHTDIKPIVIEKSDYMGGISRTVRYKGNRMDIGGHRFFSKSDRVMEWWLRILPMQEVRGPETEITYHRRTTRVETSERGPDPEKVEQVMLIRQRRSRIYYLRKFFSYPISLSLDTLSKLGLLRTVRIGLSYLRSALLPIKNPKNLEEFFINRFGRELYRTFFKSYTEKVWGTACRDISAEWGAQRIKGLSITKAILHVVKGLFARKKDIAQKGSETSLIEQFLYPKYGPGQMWEEVAKRVLAKGGEIHSSFTASKMLTDGSRVRALEAVNSTNGETLVLEGDYFFSSMPIKELVRALDCEVPAEISEISEGLVYRDFITVGLLLNELKIREDSEDGRGLIKDNWIYIQEPDVEVGRLQVFNNWSPYMVADPSKVWIGLEYFCYETDDLWKTSDDDMIELAKQELERIEVIDKSQVLDAVVTRMPKTYPAYFGSYDRFGELRKYLDSFENLFLVGRNGMHKYNNQDHSMLAAMVAVDNIVSGRKDKSNIWGVNTEEEYLEEKE